MTPQALRDTYKYVLMRRNRNGTATRIRSGITNDLERREREHQRTYGSNVFIRQVGHKTTGEAARAWEAQQPDS